ncbi:hypothetical protein [Embleya sp. NPDC001921]
MIWLTWRQFRTQALIALGALAVLAIYLVFLGLSIRDDYDAHIVGCQALNTCATAKDAFESDYKAQLTLVGALLIVVPAILGTFWGAPLVTRELESGTHRLVWNQSVTRARWLAVKLAVITVAALVLTGVFSALLTWAARPFDRLQGTRFTPLVFDARNLVPLGYAVFAFVLGTTIGLLIRRTLPAMAVTLVLFALVQVVMPYVRPHMLPAKEAAVAVNGTTLPRVSSFILDGDAGGPDERVSTGATLRIEDYRMPGAWVLTGSTKIRTADGKPATTGPEVQSCLEPAKSGLAESGECLAAQNLHFDVKYQPAGRYWTFQWAETAIFLGGALLLAGFALWRIPRSLT